MTADDDTLHLARSVLAAMGAEWQRLDAFDRLAVALGWLSREGSNPLAIAEHLRGVADLLELDPTELLHQRLGQQERDLRTLIESRVAA